MQTYNSRKLNGVSLVECLQNDSPEKEAQTYSALVKSASMSKLLNEIHVHSNKPASKSFKNIFKKLRESKSLHTASNKSLSSPNKNTMEKVSTCCRKLKNEPINIIKTPASICKPAKKDYHLPAIVTTTKQRRHTIDLAEKESGAISDRLCNAHHTKFYKSESVYSAFTTLSSLSSTSHQSSLFKRTTVQNLSQLATETDEEIQYKLWNEDTSICPKKEIAKWLGSKPDTRSNILSLYMQNFDFANRDLDEAFRLLCIKLYLKGESQQLDRIIAAFAHQYHHCNPNSLFYCVDIVHAVTYSLLLLNTDLHVVSDGANRMTKSSFVKNTMETIRLIAFPDLSIDNNEQRCVKQIKKSKSFSSSLGSLTLLEDVKSIQQANTIRLDAVKSNLSRKGSCIHYERRLTKVQKTWLIDIETLLKDMYTAVKSQRITQAAEDHIPTPSVFTLQRTNTFTCKKNNKKRHSLRQKKLFSATVEPFMAKETLETKSLPSLPTHTLKQGLVMRKHVMESSNKRARHRQWQLCYLVINSTELIMYQPLQKDQPTDLPTQKRRKSIMTWNCSLQNVVAQGDMDGWQADTDHVLDKVPMNHTYASAIPPPGWNGYRPHVFRLETAEGGLWLFESLDVYAIQAWIEAANTTAACISKGALSGAVGNVDYGWGVHWDNSTGKFTTDAIPVWNPPTPCMSISSLSLNDQHDHLENQIRDLHDQLDKHRALKLNLHNKLSSNCSQRVWNSMQALTNWDKKLHHLIHELIKLKSYKQNLYQYIKSTSMSNSTFL